MNIKHFLPFVTAVLAFCADCRADVVITLDSTRFDNAQWTSISSGGGSYLDVRGTLTGVSVDVMLVDGSPNTLASDIGIMVMGHNLDRLAQVGGGFNFYSPRHYTWANGNSDIVGTRCVDTVHLDTPFTFAGYSYYPSDPIIAMGVFSANWPNGAWATWTGTMTLIGLERDSVVPSPASSVFWLAAGALSRRVRKRGNT